MIKPTTDYPQIFLKDSLYTEYDLENVPEENLLNVLFHSDNSFLIDKLKTLDSFCTVCKKQTTFISKDTNASVIREIMTEAELYSGGNGSITTLVSELEKFGIFKRVFKCPRPESNSNHDQIFLFRIKDSKLIKIGQHPSLADLAQVEIEKYRSFNENIYQELNRAIGLSANGIGVGSFVYLRRIIEKHIVIPKLQELLNEQKITQEQIFTSDFKKKIDLAKEKLPQFLIDNKKIYSILSKGIHELEEKECKDFFPILRTSIEIILDEKIEQKERDLKNKKISDALDKFK